VFGFQACHGLQCVLLIGQPHRSHLRVKLCPVFSTDGGIMDQAKPREPGGGHSGEGSGTKRGGKQRSRDHSAPRTKPQEAA